MIPFSDWKNHNDEEKPLNENNQQWENLLGSSTSALRYALEGYIPKDAPAYSDTSGMLRELEEKVERELAAAKKLSEEEKYEEPIRQPENTILEAVADDTYKLYRDKEETFECNISVQGASVNSAQARLIIDTSMLNVVYYGKLTKDGRCLVQLGKMTQFPEGTRGRIRLEVIVDDTLFSPWESPCIVEGAKKVTVDIRGNKKVTVNMNETK